jgi:hypothetical protein
MYTRRNTKNKTNFVGTQTSGVELYLSTPFPKAKKAARLTVRTGDARIDLNGRQINALRKLLDKSYNA